jgi:hypothetical protein
MLRAIRSRVEDLPVFAKRYVRGLKSFLLSLSRRDEPDETDLGQLIVRLPLLEGLLSSASSISICNTQATRCR